MTFNWDDAVYVHDLTGRRDLNNRAARVWGIAPRSDGRIGIEMMLGSERVWIKPSNITLISDEEALKSPPFNGMSSDEISDLKMFFWANAGSTRYPGIPARIIRMD